MQHQNNAFCFILPFLFPKYICPLKAQALCAFSMVYIHITLLKLFHDVGWRGIFM